jgi:repressor LexA
MATLTPRQQQIFDLIRDTIRTRLSAHAEIAAEFGFSSPIRPRNTCRRWRARA